MAAATHEACTGDAARQAYCDALKVILDEGMANWVRQCIAFVLNRHPDLRFSMQDLGRAIQYYWSAPHFAHDLADLLECLAELEQAWAWE